MSEETTKKDTCDCDHGHEKVKHYGKYKSRIQIGSGGIGWIGFWAYVGAAVFFVSQANGFWEGALGLLKAAIWPAFLAYEGLHAVGL
jgi:hypothetical protein